MHSLIIQCNVFLVKSAAERPAFLFVCCEFGFFRRNILNWGGARYFLGGIIHFVNRNVFQCARGPSRPQSGRFCIGESPKPSKTLSATLLGTSSGTARSGRWLSSGRLPISWLWDRFVHRTQDNSLIFLNKKELAHINNVALNDK